MWFNILTDNHGKDPLNLEALAPMFAYFRSVLSKCGHDVTIVADQFYPDAVNLYFEYFSARRDYAAAFRQARQQHGYRIGVIATELMIGGAIPYAQRGIRIENAPKDEYARLIRERVDGFERVAPEVDFLWCLLERTAHEYKGRCPVTEFFPVGCLRDIPAEERRAPKDIDVFFFGVATPHRTEIMHRLGKTGLRMVFAGRDMPAGWQPSVHMESLMDRAKIVLNLTLHAKDDAEGGVDPRFVSCLRMKEMLERGACVVSEDIPLDNPYRDCMISAPVERLAEVCLELLRTGAWRERGIQARERFRSEMDAQRVCGPIVERTLAAIAR